MTTIKLKNGSGAPTSGDLAQGEPALDLTNKRLYTEDSGGTVIEVGTNPGVDVTFADDRKAIFGAGSDLQIYHDGSASYISDQGTGNLKLLAGSFRVRNSADTENIMQGNENGTVSLYYDNSVKFATTSTGIDVTGEITTDGMTTSADINFGDSDKAIFGADSDLQLYHSGSHSYIIDNGTGDLKIYGANIEIGNTSGVKNLFATSGGATALYFNNASKLATTNTGIDVSGTIDSDGTFNPDTSDWATASFKGTGSYGGGIAFVDGSAGFANYVLSSGSTYRIGQGSTSGGLTTHFQISNSGDISFYDSAGTTAKLFWDASAESLGIGTASPDAKLEVAGSTNDDLFNLTGAGTNFELRATSGNGATPNSSVYRLALDYLGTYTNGFIDFYRGGAGNDGYLAFGSAGTEAMRITSGGILEFNNDAVISVNDTADSMYFGGGGTVPNTIQSQASALHNWQMGGSNVMRIDSSGNLLVGTSNTTWASEEGLRYFNGSSLIVTRDSDEPLNLNRLTNDGSIAVFKKDGTTVGSIGTEVSDGTTPAELVITAGTVNSARLWLKGGDSGLILDGHTNSVLPTDENSYEDNRTDLGSSSYRFKDLYLSGEIYNTAAYNQTTGLAANMYVNSAGRFFRSTSSERYKNTIQDATHGLTELLTLRPVTYKGNNDGDLVFGGLIAEEVHDAGLTEFVQYNEDNQPDALAYGNMVSLCIKAIQEQNQIINDLRARVAQLENN